MTIAGRLLELMGGVEGLTRECEAYHRLLASTPGKEREAERFRARYTRLKERAERRRKRRR